MLDQFEIIIKIIITIININYYKYIVLVPAIAQSLFLINMKYTQIYTHIVYL